MISVSNEFKEAIKDSAREFKGYLYDIDADTYIRDDDDLKSIKITSEGDLFKTVIRQAEVKYFGDHDLLGKYVKLGIGIILAPVTDKGTVTMTIASPCVVTLATHGLSTGDEIKLSTTGAVPTGLVVDTYYYVVKVNENTFNLAVSFENAVADSPTLIATTGSQSGTHSLDYYPISGDGDTEYIDYGTFLVVEQETSEGEEHTTLKLYDTMIESLKVYNLGLQDYPITLKQYLEAICTRLEWTLATTSFFNDDLEVDSDLFILKENMTYRIALEHIAQATVSILYFDEDNELVVKEIGDTSLETVDTEIKSLNLKPEFEVNSVVLASVPEGGFVYSGGYYHERILLQDGDNLLTQDGEPLRLQALHEIDDIVQIKFENNYLLDEEKDANVIALGTELIGKKFYPFKASTFGNGYFEIGDRITVVDKGSTEREVLVLSMITEFNNGFRETLEAGVPVYAYQGTKENGNTVMDIVLKAQIDGGKNIEDDSITDTKIKSMSADKITAGTISVVTDVGSSDSQAKVVIDGEETNIKVTDRSGNKRVTLGDIEGNGVDYGLEVLDNNGEILFNEKKIKIQYTFSTFMSSPSASGADVTGWVHYGTTDYKNVCIRLDFVKPENFTVTSATVYYRMQDFLADVATRLKDIDLYLNPTKTLVNGAAYQDYYRYSAGDSLKTNIDPNADDFEGSEVFTSGEIANIEDGWNYLIAQQSFDDTAFGFMGYCALTLVLNGYLEP